MEIVHSLEQLERYMHTAVQVSGDSPVLLDSFLQDAVEVDVDAICDGDRVYVAGIMEHIEEAGIHSGDSACSLPPYNLKPEIIAELKRQTNLLAHGLKVVGLMNIQFAVKGDDIYILEVNPRASRTVPFVAKATGIPIAKIAARVMAGEKLDELNVPEDTPVLDHVAVKEAVFPFSRFPGVDIILGPEMKSTGEVMGIDKDFPTAFAKAQQGASVQLPTEGGAFISVRDRDKEAISGVAKKLVASGFELIATSGTGKYLKEQGLAVRIVNKVPEGRPHCVDTIQNGDIQLVINTTEGAQAISDSFSIRRSALVLNIPHYTTVAGADAAVRAIDVLKKGTLAVSPLQDYFTASD